MIFYFDHVENQQIGKFFIGKSGNKLTHCPDQTDLPFGFPQDTIAPSSGSLVFIHCGKPSPFSVWETYAGKHADIDFVLMSTQPASLPYAEGNMHICKYPAHELDRHQPVLEFFDCLAQGEKKWNLLFPKPYPEALTAAYLLLVAHEKMNMPLKGLTANHWAEAGQQYQENCGADGTDWSCFSNWDDKTIGIVKTKIGNFLSSSKS